MTVSSKAVTVRALLRLHKGKWAQLRARIHRKRQKNNINHLLGCWPLLAEMERQAVRNRFVRGIAHWSVRQNKVMLSANEVGVHTVSEQSFRESVKRSRAGKCVQGATLVKNVHN